MTGSLEERFQNLHEFVTQARINLDRNNWDHLIGGSETETTLARNRAALEWRFSAAGFARRLNVDCSRTLLGKDCAFRCCVLRSGLSNVRPGGGATIAAATRTFGNGMFNLVGIASRAREDREGLGRRVQDFPALRPRRRRLDRRPCARTIDKGYDAFCFTIDTDSHSRRERDIAKRHQLRGMRVEGERIHQARFNWRDIERIKKNFDIPLVLKGIGTAEDTKIALEHGVDCVYVSNHGGRQLDQGVGSIDVLPEVVEAVGGRARVIVDGGIYRGTDVVKALILGADVVSVGRLYVYGLAAAGAPGVVRLFEILEDEIRICLSLLGVNGYHELDKSYIRPARQVVTPHVHSVFPHLNLPRETY